MKTTQELAKPAVMEPVSMIDGNGEHVHFSNEFAEVIAHILEY